MNQLWRCFMSNSVIGYYNTYDEDGRLFRDNSHQIEWLTTMHYFDDIIPASSKIFDGCAGTGNYAFRLAEQGHHHHRYYVKKASGYPDVGRYICRRYLCLQSL